LQGGGNNRENELIFLVLFIRPVSGPALLAVYRSVPTRLKGHFTLATAVAANGCVYWFWVERLKKVIIFEARPPCLGVTQHLRVFF